MASQQPAMSARDRIRASERALGYNVAQGSQSWASARRPGLDRPMRSTRMPTPLQAPPPTPVPAHAAVMAQSAAAAAQAMAAEEAEADEDHHHQGEHPQDGGYGTDGTEQYEAVGDELEPEPPQHQEDDQLRVLQLEQEVAQLRLQVHNLLAELERQRRVQRQQRQLDQLKTGPYWISRTRR